jgi:hypothetical protein
MLPRPEKLYFSMGRPIETTRYRGKSEDPAVLERVRARVQRSLNRLIEEARDHRAHHPAQGTLRQLINRF